MATNSPKKEIAILGAGIGGLSAAWHLSHPDNPKSKDYTITVYQQGWLLGGKCASVKNSKKHFRIEEHGVHLFGGGYFNALSMMKECFEELSKRKLRKKSDPMGTFETAFHHQDFSGMWITNDMSPPDPNDPTGNKSRRSAQVFYPAVQVPNTKTIADYKSMPTAFDWLVAMLQGGLASIIGRLAAAAHGNAAAGAAVQKVIALAPANTKATAIKDMKAILAAYQKQIAGCAKLVEAGTKIRVDAENWDFVEGEQSSDSKKPKVPKNAEEAEKRIIRMKMAAAQGGTVGLYLELLSVLTKAFVEDLLNKKAGFDSLDDQDYISWLLDKGASEELIASPLAIAHPNILFAYPNGDTSQIPKMSAGAFFYWMLRISAYLGHYAYRFVGGTGETVIAPLYKVLKARGVKFEFFHTVKDVRLGADGKSIDSIDFDVQAKTKDGSEYEPLKTHKNRKGETIEYWPEEPDYDKLDGPANWKELAEQSGFNMESYWWQGQPVENKRLYASQDFDHIVMAMSLAALPSVCTSFRGRLNNWDQMFDKMQTTPTQAIQIWTEKKLGDLGHPVITEKDKNPAPNVKLEGNVTCANYNTPFSCHVDFTDLIDQEGWPKTRCPKGLVYFCGPMIDFESEDHPADPDFPKRTHIRVEATAFRFLQTATYPLMPKATNLVRDGFGDHRGMDFSVLYSSGGQSGFERLCEHYIRANVNPTDRYVLSVPGSGKTRIRHNATGIDNLSVAGDWIYTGINAGCVEGTVMSGKLASNNITAWPKEEDIIGFNSTPWQK